MERHKELEFIQIYQEKFNDIEESKLTMTWQLKDEKSFPKISAMYLTDVSVVKNGGWVDYE